MFSSMPITKKIVGAFCAVILAVLVMMGVIWSVLTRIDATSTTSVRGQDVLAQSLSLEIAILRQNSQMRGFLITADESYLKQYREAYADGATAEAKLKALLTSDPAAMAQVAETTRKAALWKETIGDPLIERARVERMAAQDTLRSASKTVTMVAVLAPLRKIRADVIARGEAARVAREHALWMGHIALLLGGIVMVGTAMALAAMLSRMLARPIVQLTGVMDTLARGDHGIDVPDTARGDEIGSMSRAVLVFRDAAIAKATADAQQQQVVSDVGSALARLADSDLRTQLRGFPPAYASLERDFNMAVAHLSTAMGTVRGSAGGIATSTAEMHAATDDLAQQIGGAHV